MKPPHMSLPFRVIPKKCGDNHFDLALADLMHSYRAGFASMAGEAGISVLITNHSGTAGPQR